MPLDVTLTVISLDKTTVQLSGYSLSEQGINVFVNGLTKNLKFSQVNLSSVGQKENSSEINFTLSANLAK